MPPYQSQTPAELVANSKTKFALGQARLRRRQIELALLSFHGSLEDALRAYLMLHHHIADAGDWHELLDTLGTDARHPLSRDEAERLRRAHSLRERITRGESVTLAVDSVLTYQQFAATILARYGVIVAAPESTAPFTLPPPATRGQRIPRLWRRITTQFKPGLIIIVILIIGATATVVLQRSRSPEPAVVHPATTLTAQSATDSQPTTAILTPTVLPSTALAPGQTAYVRTDSSDGLALRAQPGTGPDIPIYLYLSNDTAVEVLAGPVEVDGSTWWQIRAANRVGWCAEEFLEVR